MKNKERSGLKQNNFLQRDITSESQISERFASENNDRGDDNNDNNRERESQRR